MANFVSYDNATELMTAIGEKISALSGAYIFRGSVTFANLPSTLTKAMTGYVYNVSDDFTTTADFIEGAGNKYPAGTNVAVANVGTDETPSMKFDVVGSFYDIDAILTMISGTFDATTAYSTGDVVIYDNSLYKFTADHAAGAWDTTEVDSVTVVELIADAEPASLTTAQVTALLALLD